MFKISLDESLKNFDKNRFITILSVFLFALLFVLEGYTMSYHTINEYRKTRGNHETFQNWGVYTFSSNKTTRQIFVIEPSLNDNLDIETLKFWEKVECIDNLEYVSLNMNSLCIKFCEKLLGNSNLYEYTTGSDYMCVNCTFVSPSFSKNERYRVIEGRDFTEDDFICDLYSPRPVLLGYKYRDCFEVGDVLELYDPGKSYHLGSYKSIKIIGFIEEDTTVFEAHSNILYDLDTYIIIPTVRIPYSQYMDSSEEVKAIAMNSDYFNTLMKTKFLIPEGLEAEVLPQLQEALNEYSGFAKFYSIVDKKAYVERLQERTETVTNFSASITVVLSVFAFITIITTIANRISRNIKDYAIHITVGATKNSVVLYIIMEMLFVLLFGFVFGLIILKPLMNYQGMPFLTPASWVAFGVTALIILAISAITSKIVIRKYDICTLIK